MKAKIGIAIRDPITNKFIALTISNEDKVRLDVVLEGKWYIVEGLLEPYVSDKIELVK